MGLWFYIMVFYTYLIRFYNCCTVLHSVLCKERVEDIGSLLYMCTSTDKTEKSVGL